MSIYRDWYEVLPGLGKKPLGIYFLGPRSPSCGPTKGKSLQEDTPRDNCGVHSISWRVGSHLWTYANPIQVRVIFPATEYHPVTSLTSDPPKHLHSRQSHAFNTNTQGSQGETKREGATHKKPVDWVFTDSCNRDSKIVRDRLIPPKLSVAISFRNDRDTQSLKRCHRVSCGFFNKRDWWKMMHRQTKCCQLNRSTDKHDTNRTGFGKIVDTSSSYF